MTAAKKAAEAEASPAAAEGASSTPVAENVVGASTPEVRGGAAQIESAFTASFPPGRMQDHVTPHEVNGGFVSIRARVASALDVPSGPNVRLQIQGVGEVWARWQDLELVFVQTSDMGLAEAPPPNPPTVEGGQP